MTTTDCKSIGVSILIACIYVLGMYSKLFYAVSICITAYMLIVLLVVNVAPKGVEYRKSATVNVISSLLWLISAVMVPMAYGHLVFPIYNFFVLVWSYTTAKMLAKVP